MIYIALLRGINVGGNKQVPMKQLKNVFESCGYTNVATILATGNVIFESSEGSSKTLEDSLERQLQKSFGFTIPVIIRTQKTIEKLIKNNPFEGIAITPNKRLYVTFLKNPIISKLPIPYTSPDGNYQILTATKTEVVSVLTLSPQTRSIDAMKILEKEFGKEITTRNWNTLLKLQHNSITR